MTEVYSDGAATAAPRHRVLAVSAGHWLLWIPVALCFAVLVLITVGAQAPARTDDALPRCVIDIPTSC